MRKTIASLGVAAALVAGSAAALSADTAALAQDDTTTTSEVASPLEEVLEGLVADGVITQTQADAIEEALADQAPLRRGFRHHGGPSLEVAAETIGIDVAELRAALVEGDSIADVAEAQDADVDSVVAALVAHANERLDQAVTDGRISAESADERRADIADRVEAFVNGEHTRDGGEFGRRGPGRFGPGQGFGQGGGTDTPGEEA